MTRSEQVLFTLGAPKFETSRVSFGFLSSDCDLVVQALAWACCKTPNPSSDVVPFGSRAPAHPHKVVLLWACTTDPSSKGFGTRGHRLTRPGGHGAIDNSPQSRKRVTGPRWDSIPTGYHRIPNTLSHLFFQVGQYRVEPTLTSTDLKGEWKHLMSLGLAPITSPNHLFIGRKKRNQVSIAAGLFVLEISRTCFRAKPKLPREVASDLN